MRKSRIDSSQRRRVRGAMNDLNSITHDIIKAAIEVHKELGPGLLESVYRKCLAKVLRDFGYDVKEELDLPLKFRGEVVEEHAY
jgi:GxxExxY protein